MYEVTAAAQSAFPMIALRGMPGLAKIISSVPGLAL